MLNRKDIPRFKLILHLIVDIFYVHRPAQQQVTDLLTISFGGINLA